MIYDNDYEDDTDDDNDDDDDDENEDLTPLDNSFSTAAFSRAISPRTILTESFMQRKKKIISHLPFCTSCSSYFACMPADPVKGDIHTGVTAQ